MGRWEGNGRGEEVEIMNGIIYKEMKMNKKQTHWLRSGVRLLQGMRFIKVEILTCNLQQYVLFSRQKGISP